VAGAVACAVGEGAGLGWACGHTGNTSAKASNNPRIFLIIELSET
jgi:hypothetical protein